MTHPDLTSGQVWVHEAAWIKLNKNERNPQRGFAANNYKRYNYTGPRGLERWIKRNRITNRPQQGIRSNTNQTFYQSPKTTKGKNNKGSPELSSGCQQHPESLQQIRRRRYETLEPTGHRVEIETLDQLVAWIQKYTPYMQGKWNNANTRETARILFFEVFKKGDSTLIGKPRDSGKSKVSVAVYLCILANYWYPQGIIVNGPKAKRRIYNGLHRVLIYNPQFRKDYGDIISSKNKVEGALELHPSLVDKLYDESGYVTDDPAIQISVYSGIVGAHPFVVWLEDILQSEFKSMESNEYLLYEVFDGIIVKLADRIGGTFTRKGMEDLYSQLPTRNILLFARGAIWIVKGRWPTINDLVYDDEGRAININIPEDAEYGIIERPGWTVKSLLIMRTLALKDPRSFEMFEREMQNNPILSEGLYFKDCLMEEIEPFIHGELANRHYMIMDPAFGKSAKSSDTAIIVIAIFRETFYIVDVVIGKFNDTEMFEECAELHDKYGPLEFHAENDFEQLYKNTTLLKKLRTLRGFRVFYQKGFGEKLARIEQLHPPLYTKQFKIYNIATHKSELQNQIRTYNRREGKFDGLDALASGYRLLYPKLNSSRRKGSRVI